MYERKNESLLSRHKFFIRMLNHLGFAFIIVAISLMIGILGYHFIAGFGWVDSLLNSSMLLGGMGPVNEITSRSGKIFASLYALYSGLVLLVVVGILVTPLYHRFFHHFHLEMDEDEKNSSNEGDNRD